MNLRKYKLRTILIVGFGIVIVLIMTFIAFISIQMNRLADITVDMFNHPLTVSNTVRDIEINIYSMNRLLNDAVLIDKPDELENAIIEIDSLQKSTLQKFDIVDKLFLGNPRDVDEAYEAFIGWKPVWQQIIQLMEQGDRNKAVKVIREENKIYVNMMFAIAGDMIEFANNKGISFNENSKAIRRSINMSVVIFSFLLILVTFIIGFVITKSITDPINKIVRNIVRISKQNFGVDIDFKGNHHLILLENSVNKLEELSNELVKEFNNKKEIQSELEESQKAMIYLLEDVNEVKAELERVVIQLRYSNQEMESFIYSISHDLRAPLRSIMGFSEIIVKRQKDRMDPEGIEYFGYIIEASKNMANLIEDLLRFSRLAKNKNEKEAIDLNEVLELVLTNLNKDIEDNRAKIILPDNLPTVYADRSLLLQIFANLIQNAIMYRRDGVNPEINLSIESDEENYIIKVKDNGQGIPQEHHQKIFNIFQRLHSQDDYPGTGIGLAIVKKAVAALGGSISLESEVGKGTTFLIMIPKK